GHGLGPSSTTPSDRVAHPPAACSAGGGVDGRPSQRWADTTALEDAITRPGPYGSSQTARKRPSPDHGGVGRQRTDARDRRPGNHADHRRADQLTRTPRTRTASDGLLSPEPRTTTTMHNHTNCSEETSR